MLETKITTVGQLTELLKSYDSDTELSFVQYTDMEINRFSLKYSSYECHKYVKKLTFNLK